MEGDGVQSLGVKKSQGHSRLLVLDPDTQILNIEVTGCRADLK